MCYLKITNFLLLPHFVIGVDVSAVVEEDAGDVGGLDVV